MLNFRPKAWPLIQQNVPNFCSIYDRKISSTRTVNNKGYRESAGEILLQVPITAENTDFVFFKQIKFCLQRWCDFN